jgi:uncharacterized protein (DUF433 family)
MLAVARLEPFTGIYEVPDAARLLRITMPDSPHFQGTINSRRLIRWIRNRLTNPGLIETPGREILITFDDLISMRIIAALRASGFSFPTIYMTEKWLRERTGSRYPFTTEKIWTGSEIFTELGNTLVAASRSKAGQYAFDFIRDSLIRVQDVEFGHDHLVSAWTPRVGIRIDPKIQFGAPCIQGTRIPTETLWSMVEAGDAIPDVAKWYGLDSEVVSIAVAWERALAAA